MSDKLKTIKELADELGVSKKYLQNKISYETKKQGLSIGDWKIISGKKTRILSDKEQEIIKGWVDKRSDNSDSQEDKRSDNSDSQEDKRSDRNVIYLKERITSLETFLNKEQESNSELRTIIQQTQNLLDQQQRLALQDKKLLEEYKAEINNLKTIKMPLEDTKVEQAGKLVQEVQSTEEEPKKATRKWYQIWK